MKKKRPKDSIFHDSIKNKRRKQEEKIDFYKNKENNHQKSGSFSNQNKTNHTDMNYFFSNPNYGTGNNASTREERPFFGTNIGLKPDYTYHKQDQSGSGYRYKTEEENHYFYGFTNSKFIYFLGTLEPRAYLIFITLIALLIIEDLNTTESTIIYAFISDIAYTMRTVVEQEIILDSYAVKQTEREQGAALQKDFDTLYSEINQLKKEMNHFKK